MKVMTDKKFIQFCSVTADVAHSSSY